MKKLRIAFLGYGPKETALLKHLEARGHDLTNVQGPVSNLSGYDRVISFGYRHILREHVLDSSYLPVLNLHMSLLPFNKGAHPNFWAWVEGTPHGVTLHEMTAGLDEGPIVDQREFHFKTTDISFRESYSLLFNELEQLFIENLPDIEKGSWTSSPQIGQGTHHYAKDLPSWLTSWDIPVQAAERDNL